VGKLAVAGLVRLVQEQVDQVEPETATTCAHMGVNTRHLMGNQSLPRRVERPPSSLHFVFNTFGLTPSPATLDIHRHLLCM
jgi:hypothetical protein